MSSDVGPSPQGKGVANGHNRWSRISACCLGPCLFRRNRGEIDAKQPKYVRSDLEWNILAGGNSGWVSVYDKQTVLKGSNVYWRGKEVAFMGDQADSRRSLNRELQVYRRLPPHRNVLGFYGTVRVAPGEESLRLEYAHQGDLRTFMKHNRAPRLMQRLRWVCDLASALVHLHSNKIMHHDLSCRNLFLTSKDELKLGDFGGSALEGQKPLGAAESRYQLPRRGREYNELPVVKEEIFALGSAIYEILAWQPPFLEVEDEFEVDERYEKGEFPDLAQIQASDVVQGCWWEQYNSVAQVEQSLNSLLRAVAKSERQVRRRRCVGNK